MVVVREDGTFTRLERVEELTHEARNEADHLWVWSGEAAPARLEARADLGSALEPDERRLRLRVVSDDVEAPDSDPEPGMVIAAPVEMWEEVPEDLLPMWPLEAAGSLEIPVDGRSPLRVRWVGDPEGSGWIDVEPGVREVRLLSRPASDLAFRVLADDGDPVEHPKLRVFPGRSPQGLDEPWAVAGVGPPGEIFLPSVLSGQELTLWVEAPGYVPATWVGQTGDFPEEIRLTRGTAVRGTFVDEDDQPVPGVDVTVTAWVAPDVPETYSRTATSDPGGTWSVAALPMGQVAVTARSPAHSLFRERFETTEAETDLGELVLHPRLDLRVRVIDDLGEPVPGAHVQTRIGIEAYAGARGEAVLRGVPPGEPVRLWAEAAGHRQSMAVAPPPFTEPVTLRLSRAFTVTGRVVDGEGTALPGGVVRAVTFVDANQTQQSATDILGDGSFVLALPPERATRLTLEPSAARKLIVDLEPGRAGDVRDLGDLQPPSGLVVTGRFLAAETGRPVPGVRLWTPDPDASHPLNAWVFGRLLETSSDEDGRFRLTGLPLRPALLRGDAPGYARVHLAIEPGADQEAVDLGDVELTAGATVRVVLEGFEERDRASRVARVDLGGEGLELDRLQSPVADDTATLGHVPPGPAELEVTEGQTVICRRGLDVPERGELEVRCGDERLSVRGRVFVAGAAAAGGSLTWLPPESSGISMSMTSPEGLPFHREFSAGPRQVSATVASDGTFETDGLEAGPWQVHYFGRDGAAVQPLDVRLPESGDHWVRLDYEGLVLRGRVVDGEGRPVGGALVTELVTGAGTRADAAGVFSLRMREPGAYRLKARHEEGLESPVVATRLEPGDPGEPVTLVLRKARDDRLTVAVLGRGSVPASGGFVFLETDRGLRVLTADSRGRATLRVTEPLPRRIRAAAWVDGLWLTTAWQSWDAARDGFQVGPPTEEPGALLLTTEERSGTVSLTTPDGWRLAPLMTRLGMPPNVSPEFPARVSGLAPGSYTVSLGGSRWTITVRAGDLAELEME